jgi:hypothetical protein
MGKSRSFTDSILYNKFSSLCLISELFFLLKDNSEIKHNDENLLYNIESVKLRDFPIVCYLFVEFFKDISNLIFYFVNMFYNGIIYVILFGITLTIGVLINWFLVELGCENLPYI